jgi:hypothetical protein
MIMEIPWNMERARGTMPVYILFAIIANYREDMRYMVKKLIEGYE